MKYHNFYMRVLCLLLIGAAIIGYNFMQDGQARQEEIKDLTERISSLEAQQTEILEALEANAAAQEEAARKAAEQKENSEKAAEESGEGAAGSDEESSTEGLYQDGTYEGEGTGFGGTIRVQITLSDQQLTDIQILSADGEDSAYLNSAKGIIDTILAEQSTDVDTVSGATFSSTGILNAVVDALGKAENQ